MHPFLSSWLSARLVDRRAGHRRHVLHRQSLHVQADFRPVAERAAQTTRDLADLLEHAGRHVPFYRDRLPPGPVDSDHALDVLRSLPPLQRAAIQSEPSRFVDASARDLVDDFTGGSTGTPLTFKVDRATQQAREASLMWANSLAGWFPGARIAMLWGSDRDTTAAFRDWRLNLRWWLDNMRWYNAFRMGEAEMAAFHRAMTRFRPHLVVGYAGSLDVFARFLDQTSIRPSYPLTSLVSSAEMLVPATRKLVERVFGKPVFDRYGNREAGAIAAECDAHDGLHVNEHDFIVEIDSPNPEREPGPLLITYLANRAMPLIRYDTGDLAVWATGPCACGRTTRRLARIAGRQSDTIRTASGELIHGEYFTHVLYGAEGVREFQFVQEDLHRYILRVVTDAIRPEHEADWRKKIEPLLGPGSALLVERVAEIPALASGKRRFTISNLKTSEGRS